MPDPSPYEVHLFTERQLYKALSNKRFTPSEVSKHPQAKYIKRYLEDPEMKAKIILVENDYTDRDYLDDYANYYAKCFDEIPRLCKRLHFFSADLSKVEFSRRFERMIKGGKDNKIVKSYLGFVVARPLPITIIGRTLLKTYPTTTKKGKRRKFCMVKGENAHLFGVDFPIDSLAFQEQDHTLAACATVSIWSCFHKTRSLFHTPMLTPAEITQRANEALQVNRPIPSDGLKVEQIIYAIGSNGLVAETFDIKKRLYLRSVLYAYMHYGLPVILGLYNQEWESDHAIALSGYSLDIKPNVPLVDEIPLPIDTIAPPSPKKAGKQGKVLQKVNPIAFTSSRIDRFFAHDDEMGPYSKLVIGPLDKTYDEVLSEARRQNRLFSTGIIAGTAVTPPTVTPSKSDPEIVDSPLVFWRIPEDSNGKREFRKKNLRKQKARKNQPLRSIPYVVIIPLYHKIRVNIQDIQEWVFKLNVWLDKKHCLEDTPREFLEWDVYLTDIYEFKRDLQNITGQKKSLLSAGRIKRHPRFIWRATLKFGSTYLMDLLGDATDIGGSANPFYDVLFYNRDLERKFQSLFSKATERSGVLVIAKQLDGFFFKHFNRPA